MDPLIALIRFFERISEDKRVGSTHVGVFAAALHYSIGKGGCNPVMAYSHEIMPIAKITALRTYCRCVRELHEYGYIEYTPSKKKNVPSRILFLN